MQKVSVIIPTHNRPDLLNKAINSICKQYYSNWEIIIIDDASTIAIDENKLHQYHHCSKIRVVRNTIAQGIAKVRYQGAQEATGDYIIQLDDDDLLAPETLQSCVTLLNTVPDCQIVFIGVDGFGEKKDYFNRVQTETIGKFLARTQPKEIEPDTFRFDQSIFEAMLTSVPSAFQHPMATRDAWLATNALRNQAFRLLPNINTETQAINNLTDPFNECEWSLYASILFNMILINKPFYLARCEGQRYYSVPAQKERHLHANIKLQTGLYRASQTLPALSNKQKSIKKSLAQAQFNLAYHFFYTLKRPKAWNPLLAAFTLSPCFAYAKFGLRMLFPPSKTEIE